MTEGRADLRVAYILLRSPSYSETFISSEIRAVRAAGATVEVFVARPGGRRAELARVVRTLFRHPVRLLAQVRTLGGTDVRRALLAGSHALALAEEVASFAPDVVHAHFVNLPTAVAALVARELGKPATAVAHAADFLLDRNPVGLARRLGLLRHLFVISAATVRQLEARGVAMSTIPHGIVRAAFDGELPEPAPPGPAGPVRLVTVARLVEKKGVGTSVDAVARLAATGLDVHYDVYGDGPLRATLERRAQECGVSAAVTFHGAVSHAVATEALATADVAVLACTRGTDGDLDGIPVFLMEAASRQVPVVTTAVSGIPELVEEGGGWLVPPDDPAALAEAVTQVVQNRAEARRRVDRLVARLRTEFPPERQAERLLDTWHRLVDPARRQRAVDDAVPPVRR